MFDYYGALAEAEIALRDEGLDVHLTPSVEQKLFVVYRTPDGEVAIKSYDGDEYKDIEKYSGRQYGALEFSGYPYNNESDLAEVITEARAEHPGVDLHLEYEPMADR